MNIRKVIAGTTLALGILGVFVVTVQCLMGFIHPVAALFFATVFGVSVGISRMMWEAS